MFTRRSVFAEVVMGDWVVLIVKIYESFGRKGFANLMFRYVIGAPTYKLVVMHLLFGCSESINRLKGC